MLEVFLVSEVFYWKLLQILLFYGDGCRLEGCFLDLLRFACHEMAASVPLISLSSEANGVKVDSFQCCKGPFPHVFQSWQARLILWLLQKQTQTPQKTGKKTWFSRFFHVFSWWFCLRFLTDLLDLLERPVLCVLEAGIHQCLGEAEVWDDRRTEDLPVFPGFANFCWCFIPLALLKWVLFGFFLLLGGFLSKIRIILKIWPVNKKGTADGFFHCFPFHQRGIFLYLVCFVPVLLTPPPYFVRHYFRVKRMPLRSMPCPNLFALRFFCIGPSKLFKMNWGCQSLVSSCEISKNPRSKWKSHNFWFASTLQGGLSTFWGSTCHPVVLFWRANMGCSLGCFDPHLLFAPKKTGMILLIRLDFNMSFPDTVARTLVRAKMLLVAVEALLQASDKEEHLETANFLYVWNTYPWFSTFHILY